MALSAEAAEQLLRVARSCHPDSNRFKQAMIILLHDIQRGFCAICGKAVDTIRNASEFALLGVTRYPLANLDHVIAKSRGGFNGLGNIVMTHSRCNVAKGAKPATACTLLWLYIVNLKLGIAI